MALLHSRTQRHMINIPSRSSIHNHFYDPKLKPLQSFKGLLVGKKGNHIKVHVLIYLTESTNFDIINYNSF